MPLIKCIDCGKEHSDIAAACPNCGRPNNAETSVRNKVPLVSVQNDTKPREINNSSPKKVFKDALWLVGFLTVLSLTYIIANIKSDHGSKDNRPTPEQTKAATLLVLASCNQNQNFKELLINSNIGLPGAFASFDAIYDLAQRQNPKGCLLLTRPQALPEVSDESQNTPTESNPTPEGWNATDKEGVYWKWCKEQDACTTDKVIGDNGYVLMQVWCKEQACGDIYGKVNLISDSNVIVGWTNDTGYGDTGQKVQLTFDTYQKEWKSARLVELNFR